jgi:hypothetical protein
MGLRIIHSDDNLVGDFCQGLCSRFAPLPAANVRVGDPRGRRLAPLCKSAGRILETAHDSAGALLKAFDLARTQRGRSAGMSTDQEQDLLRVMLVMAAAGLDGMVKQLIRDTLPSLLERDSIVATSITYRGLPCKSLSLPPLLREAELV